MKGKIVSFTPKMMGDTQESFIGHDKTFYVFVVTAEVEGNLQIGDANSTLAQPKWELNKECDVTIEKNDKSTGGNKFKFTFPNAYNSPGGKSYGKTLIERMEIISQSAFSTAIRYIDILENDERKALFEKYGPDDAFINFSKRIAKEVVKNAKELINEDAT